MTMKARPRRFERRRSWAHQGGGALIIFALALIVGCATLGVTISRVSAQAGVSSVQEAISISAFYAAETGAQTALNKLFYPDNSRGAVDAACDNLAATTLALNAPGLGGCMASLVCNRSTDAGNTTSFYQVRSTGTCGSDDLEAVRTVAVAAKLQ
jgi:MSHA biogenesis protein MshP